MAILDYSSLCNDKYSDIYAMINNYYFDKVIAINMAILDYSSLYNDKYYYFDKVIAMI